MVESERKNNAFSEWVAANPFATVIVAIGALMLVGLFLRQLGNDDSPICELLGPLRFDN